MQIVVYSEIMLYFCNAFREKAIEFIQDDELVEVTPKSIRLRKKILDTKERERANRNKANA